MASVPSYTPLLKPGEAAEQRLVESILSGAFPIQSNLPAERELASLLGVTRPTLREALQRLSRDGWLEIRHGKPTRVRDFWREGNFGVLVALASYSGTLPPDFVPSLLAVRQLLTPEMAFAALINAPLSIAAYLSPSTALPDDPLSYAEFDWGLHHAFALASTNPFFTFFTNSVRQLYSRMGVLYFAHARTRQHSARFYADLLATCQPPNPEHARRLCADVMRASREFWLALSPSSQEKPL